MSLRIKVISEDPTWDQYIVRPVVNAIMVDLNRPARVEMLTDPHLHGVDQAIEAVPGVMGRYRLHDLFILVLDRDGDPGRADRVRSLLDRVAGMPKPLVCCLAEQEIEAWLLAAQWSVCRREHPRWRWASVRDEPHLKERYFTPFFQNHRNLRLPGQGRAQLMEGLNLDALMDKCPDVRGLRDAIARSLGVPVSAHAKPDCRSRRRQQT